VNRNLREYRLLPIVLCSTAITLSTLPAVAVAAYPVKPIRVIVPSSPSSGPDIVARLIGGWFTQAWGQQVVADNRTGAAGNIGAELAARSAPDGYTLLLANSQQVISAAMLDRLAYDLVRDFTPVTLISTSPYVLVVHPAVAATSVKELIALAKAQPGVLNYGSSGTGGAPHLAAEMFRTTAGVKILHVPYKSVVFALTDLMGGQIQFAFSVLPAAQPAIRQGRLRALGVSSLKRTALAPELEPVADSLPGFEMIGWLGIAAPAGTPARIVALLNEEIQKALTASEIRERLQAVGFDIVGAPPREFAAFIRTQLERMRATVAATGVRAQ
jgi:tripartite-type tricarboxylate transporter receptor subunit TctC